MVKGMYKFKEVECPKCKHRFTWMVAPNGKSYYLYSKKGEAEELFSAICPQCNLEMIVPNNEHVGIPITDKAVEISSAIRGI